jgi:AcrR family transcriptional regulator
MTDRVSARGRPTADQSALIADRIIAAAWEVLVETGPEQFSLDRVALAAHASKQTIYARFSGKLDLLQAVLAARIDMIYAEMHDFHDAEDAHAAFADLADRAVRSLSAPESRMLDQVMDWIDAAVTGCRDWPTRRVVYEEVQAMIRNRLEYARERWGLKIEDIPAAASFWLDSLVGHVRGVPLEGEELEHWPALHARYFLKAVMEN